MAANKGQRRLTVHKETEDSLLGQVEGSAAEGATNGGSIAECNELIKERANGKKFAHYFSTTDGNSEDEARKVKSFNIKKQEEYVAEGSSVADATGGRIHARCHKGKKPESPNQDNFIVAHIEDTFTLYGVFDGHGPKGHYISDIAREHLVTNALRQLVDPDCDVPAMFSSQFPKTQEFIRLQSAADGHDATTSGTTCTMAFHDHKKGTLVVAYVADSRMICAKATSLTTVHFATIDHKPEMPEERERIESANGRVIFDGYYNHRVFSKRGMYPGLNMSRALGDLIAHSEAGLTAEPEVYTLDLRETGEIMMLICSDGVWEFIENDESLTLVLESGGFGSKACADLAQQSYDRWMEDSSGEITDDISVIIAMLLPPA